MNHDQAAIRNISDTACWAALYRAQETERKNPLFQDPFARRLAGERGEQISAAMPSQKRHAWAWVTRTLLFDRFILDQVEKGVDTVLNLAAGLDARPYRLPLPPSLRWIEVDLPAVLDYKERVLTAELPGCALERVRLDLADVEARRARFAEIGAAAGKVLIISEGLLIYLTGEEVASLAQDLSAPAAFSRWVLDLASPGLLKMLQKQIGSQLSDAGAPLKFAPEEGPAFFAPRGWRSTDVRSMLRAASEAKRTPLWLSLLARLPEPPPGQAGSRPWSGVCLLEKADAT